jgi:hypothetical protein
MHKIKSPIGTLRLFDDGYWFFYPDSPNQYMAVEPDESNYAFSHGGTKYRAACEAIYEWKKATGWGITPD